ncbi:hypothetical protein NDU88_005392 [Pleurodeles waltl]|uniref:Uncharacterized protein n=1 Tax=Pleurodeles waltl TaxID=8319 RepID=A0AAV7SLI7_PLEWA|nr:hypothetical protein NDU88_005392 [Pleurodeles waltl]
MQSLSSGELRTMAKQRQVSCEQLSKATSEGDKFAEVPVCQMEYHDKQAKSDYQTKLAPIAMAEKEIALEEKKLDSLVAKKAKGDGASKGDPQEAVTG